MVSRVPRATSGSSWRNQFTGQPRNCHHSVAEGRDHAEPQEKQKKESLADASYRYDAHAEPAFKPTEHT